VCGSLGRERRRCADPSRSKASRLTTTTSQPRRSSTAHQTVAGRRLEHDDTTVLTNELTLQVRGVARFIAPAAKAGITSEVAANLRVLKRMLETGLS
jgi:hypothetical protein